MYSVSRAANQREGKRIISLKYQELWEAYPVPCIPYTPITALAGGAQFHLGPNLSALGTGQAYGTVTACGAGLFEGAAL